eukprot:1155132-Amphidinium_carterae.1
MTRKRYEAGAMKIKQWAKQLHHKLHRGCNWDRLFADYLNFSHVQAILSIRPDTISQNCGVQTPKIFRPPCA